MAIRTDVTVDWNSSPRIIEVAAPSTEITIQDLVDTLRDLEDELPNLQYDQIISAAGKEELGGGVKVGITATLLNALLQFEARPGPTYVQCNVSGGNLVAVDDVGATQTTPINPTAFTQVVVTASSSATLQEQTDIQFSSFNNHVTLDVDNGVAGTTYPIGTDRQPVSNLSDALTIASERGFSKIEVLSALTITATDVVDGYEFFSDNWSEITVESGASTVETNFTKISLFGELSGVWNVLTNCWVTATNFTGIMDGGSFDTLSLAAYGGEAPNLFAIGQTFLDNILPIEPNYESILTMDTNAEVVFSHLGANVTVKSMTSTDSGNLLTATLKGGHLTLDNTNTGGNVHVSGVGEFTDNSATVTVNSEELSQLTLATKQNVRDASLGIPSSLTS